MTKGTNNGIIKHILSQEGEMMMKLKLINKGKLQNIKHKIVLLATTLTMAATGLVGCGKEDAKKPAAPDTSVATVTEVPTTENYITTETYDTTEVETESSTLSQTSEYSYSQENWNKFKDGAWDSIKGKINNVNQEDFNSALLVFNLDYLSDNNIQIVYDEFSKGIDVENELNKAYSILSQVREYNTTIKTADKFYSFNNLIISPKDRAIIAGLEEYARQVKTLSTDLSNEENRKQIETIFNNITEFSLGNVKLSVNVNGNVANVAQIELTRGGILASENIMQDISVMCQNVISEEKRRVLDNSLRSKDALAEIEMEMTKDNAVAGAIKPQSSVEETNQIVQMIRNNREIVAKEVAPMNVTKEEAYALYTVANIDYLMDTASSQNAFKILYNEYFDINQTFAYAESAVSKIELYNMSVVDDSQLYTYGHFFMNSETDIISTRAISLIAHNLHSQNKSVVDENVKKLKGYTQYSSEVTITYTRDGEKVSLDKNALTKGGNQVIDWITYYAFLNNKSNIENDQLVNDMIKLVDGTTEGFNVYYDIVLMVEEYCAENNLVVYDYVVGDNSYTYTYKDNSSFDSSYDNSQNLK